MKTYLWYLIAHVAGILFSSWLTILCIQKELKISTFACIILIIAICVSLYLLQLRQIRIWRHIVDCMAQNEVIQIVRTPFKDKAMQQLANDTSAALKSFREQLLNEEIKHQYYENLLNKVDTAMIVTNLQGEIDWMNKAATELLENEKRLPDEVIEALQKKEDIVHYHKQSLVLDLAISSTLIYMKGYNRRIISLKNIHSTLKQTEMEAWQKLIRVLTHEIMNSITPIISLAQTLSERGLTNPNDEKTQAQIQQGLNIIHRRSKGLLDFVENYRKLTRVAPPVKVNIKIKDFFNDLKRLCNNPSIHFYLSDDNLICSVDRSQMEQVFLNLLKNAQEACSSISEPNIEVGAKTVRDQLIFTIQDNGEGIFPEVIERIFIPFFTTKTNGSGIGLSLCKQIITFHGGQIFVKSENGKGTCFQIVFPATNAYL